MLYFYLWIALQIVLESFPVSSSGHLSLLEGYLQLFGYKIDHLRGFFFDFLQFDFVNVYVLDHFVHGVTALVIMFFFFPRWSFLLMHLSSLWRIVLKIVALTFLADCVTALCYIGRYAVHTFFFPTGLGFIITACMLYSLRFSHETKPARFTWQKALALGFVQGVALLPGISRFAATYATGRWLRLPGRKAFEISFLLQWPLILVAFLNSLRMIAAQSNASQLLRLPTLTVMIGAGTIAFFSMYWIARCVEQKKLWLFSFYMVVPMVSWFVLVWLIP